MAIVQLLQNEAGPVASPLTTLTQSVVLPAGSNRVFVVGVGGKNGAGGLVSQTIASVTYAEIPLALVSGPIVGTPGTFFASARSGQRGIYFFILREANMPGAGANDLVVTWNGNTSWEFAAAWWVLGNASQAPLASSLNGNATTSTVVTVLGSASLDVGLASDAALVMGGASAVAGSLQLTLNAVALTEDFDIVFPTVTAGGRFAGAILNPVVNVGQVTQDVSFTANNPQNAVLAAFRIAEFVQPNPGEVQVSASRRGSVEVTVP